LVSCHSAWDDLPFDLAAYTTEGGVRLLEGGQLSTPAWSQPVDGAFVAALDRVQPDLTIVSTVDRGFGVLVADRLQMVEFTPELAVLSAWGARLAGQNVYVTAAEGVVSLPVDDLRAWWRDPSARVDWRVPASIAGNLRGSQRARCCNGGARARMVVDGPRIWLPTIDGVIALDLDDLERSVETPVVHVESATHAGRVHTPLADGAPLVVDGAARDLAVRFTAIAHRDPQGLRFAYRLDGFDTDWVDAGARREAFYTNLPPGEFTFRVRAEAASRIGSPEDATLAVRVPPRWHERVGTRLGLLFAALAVLVALLRSAVGWRERAFAAREARLRDEVEQRTAELAHANAQLRAANRALAQESETDPLTGLPNRRWLLNHLGDWLRAGGVAEDECAVLAMFDLDRFQEINTRLGRAAGDALLRQFGTLLGTLAGPQGMVVRWGGEDFLVVQRGVPREQATARAAALWRAAQEHLHPAPDGTPMLLPCSVGYSLWPPARGASAVPWSASLEMADAAAWRVRAEARKGFGGLLLAEGADPALLSGGIVGRLDALLRGGVLQWERFDGRPRAPN
jgi:diguanylate cyclase (GGDEF)-like protein